MANVNITIDGIQTQVAPGTMVLEAARGIGIDIPALCYDPTLEIYGGCRMCIVEIEGKNKMETSCSLKVKEGMVIHTQTEQLRATRKGIIQLLLDSHPNDCLTCQKAGECLLQKYAYEYGATFRDHGGAMRPSKYDLTSPYIFKDNSKCILCGKCVRSCGQLETRSVLAFEDRGYDTSITCNWGKEFDESYCVSCNRCVAVCPVGALVDKREMGKLRNWEGESKIVNCEVCEYGCEFEVRSKNGKTVAVTAEQPANGRPLCLKGRMTTELLYVDNPETPYQRGTDGFEPTTWAKVTGVGKVAARLADLDEE